MSENKVDIKEEVTQVMKKLISATFEIGDFKDGNEFLSVIEGENFEQAVITMFSIRTKAMLKKEYDEEVKQQLNDIVDAADSNGESWTDFIKELSSNYEDDESEAFEGEEEDEPAEDNEEEVYEQKDDDNGEEDESTEDDDKEAEDPWVNQWFDAYQRKSKEGAIDSFDEIDLSGDVVSVTDLSMFDDKAVDAEPEPMGKNQYEMFPKVAAERGETDAFGRKEATYTTADDASIYANKYVAPIVSDIKSKDHYSKVSPITNQLSAEMKTPDEKWIASKMRVLQQRGLFGDDVLAGEAEAKPTDVYKD